MDSGFCGSSRSYTSRMSKGEGDLKFREDIIARVETSMCMYLYINYGAIIMVS